MAQTYAWETPAVGPTLWLGASQVATDSTGACYLAGTVSGATGDNAYLAKFSPTGTKLWSKQSDSVVHGRDTGDGVVVDSSDNAYLLMTTDTAANGTEVAVRKYSPTGAVLWTRAVGGAGTEDDQAIAIALNPTGGVVVAGNRRNTSDWDPFAVQISAAGAEVWEYVAADAGDDEAVDIGVDSGGQPSLLYCTTRGGNYDGALVGLRANGTVRTTTYIGDNGELADTPKKLLVMPDGRVVVGLCSWSNTTIWDFKVACVNLNGTIRWEKQIDNNVHDDFLESLALDSAGNVIVTGRTMPLRAPDYDFAVFRLRKTDGAQLWFKTFSTSSQDDVPGAVHATASKVLAVGTVRPPTGQLNFGGVAYTTNGVQTSTGHSFGRPVRPGEEWSCSTVAADGSLFVAVNQKKPNGQRVVLVKFIP